MTSAPSLIVDEVAVENFKSIRKASLGLGPMTCLIGPNNSGKTNLLDALRFVSAVFERGLQKAVGEHGGMQKLRFLGAVENEDVLISLSARVSHDPDVASYNYVIRIASNGHVAQEALSARTKSGGHQPLFSITPEGPGQSKVRITEPEGSEQIFGMGTARDNLLQRSSSERRETLLFTSLLRKWRFYRFAPEKLKAVGAATEENTLSRDGSNFASYLHSVQSRHRKDFHRIETQLTKSFPEIEELASPLVGSNTVVSIKEKWFASHSEGNQLSDGLVGFLAHLVAIYGPEKPSLLVFEEPENYVHARLLERLVTILRETSQDVQVILTTHSVTLLNRLELNEIRLVTRGKDGTQAREPEATPELRAALREFGLGETYYSGELGGVPS